MLILLFAVLGLQVSQTVTLTALRSYWKHSSVCFMIIVCQRSYCFHAFHMFHTAMLSGVGNSFWVHKFQLQERAQNGCEHTSKSVSADMETG